MFTFIAIWSVLAALATSASTDSNFKDQFCTDPRTLRKHSAYSEWPDSYSCTRHRCQPGGRNLAIYTVGCKRVEAPESAIECEEVVEDTNMQFPYCCTRLRCLVVVRGEVWTRVLGQPWETLPAAPWSHMYKMKKPPPGDSTFLPKNEVIGPVYELQSDNENNHDKVLRASKKSSTTAPDYEAVAHAAPAPDIVIALATSNDEKLGKIDNSRSKRVKSMRSSDNFVEEDADKEHMDVELENETANDKNPESEEKLSAYAAVTQKSPSKATWTEIPPNQWNVHDPSMDVESPRRVSESKHDKPVGLQALVDAIGNRMRDIENVVQRMSEKVHNKAPELELGSGERRSDNESPRKHHQVEQGHEKEGTKPKDPGSDNDYKKFSIKKHGSKYLHSTDVTSEQPGFMDDTNMNGYFSDASNSVIKRSNLAKDPAAAPTYMAPVDNRRKSHPEISEEGDKKHKKHGHKKKRKGKGHKKHHNKEDKKKHLNKLSSAELDKNLISLEDSSTLNV